MTTVQGRVQPIRATAAVWTAENIVLLDAEVGYETDTGKFKIGDGVSTWAALPYFTGEQGETGNGIASVTLVSTVGLVKTYRITFTNATTFDYTVSDGADGADGNGIASVVLFSTVGLVKTYRITFTDATTFDYTVTDGADGAGVSVVGAADGDVAVFDSVSGEYEPNTKKQIISDLLRTGRRQFIRPRDFTINQVTSGGSVDVSNPMYGRVLASATVGSSARLSTDWVAGWSLLSGRLAFDWSGVFGFRVGFSAGSVTVYSANSIRYFVFGLPRTSTVTDPTNKCVGFRIDGFAIKGIVHNGTTLTVVDLATNVENVGGNFIAQLSVISDNGNVSFYVNGVLKGSTALGPTGAAVADQNNMSIAVTNNTDASQNVIDYHDLEIISL